MSSGKPDWNRVVTIQGLRNSTYIPLKVDASGQLRISMTGQEIEVNNLASDYLKEDGNVAVSNHPSDYFKADQAVGSITNNVNVAQTDSNRVISGTLTGITNNVNVAQTDSNRVISGTLTGITNNVNVAQTDSNRVITGSITSIANNVNVAQVDSDRTMQGKDGATPHYVAVDSAGIILSRMKGAYGGALRDVAVDTNGLMIARIKGAYGGALYDIALDNSGKMLTGVFGKIVDEEILHTLIDFGSGSPTTEWTAIADADNIRQSEEYAKSGIYGMLFTVDASKGGTRYATVYTTTSRGDVTPFSGDHLYFWVYFSTLDYLNASGSAIEISIGSAGDNRIQFNIALSELNTGWTLIKLDLPNPDATEGTIDWSSIAWLLMTIVEITDNTHDFECAVDGFVFVRQSGFEGYLTEVAVNRAGVMKAEMTGLHSGYSKPMLVDAKGRLISVMTGNFSGANKMVALDTSGNMTTNIKGVFDSAPKDLALDTNGNMIANMRGDYNGTPTSIAVDVNGVMKANLTSQDISVLSTRPKYGTYYNIQGFYDFAGTQTRTVFDDTTHKPGIIVGGNIWLFADGSIDAGYFTFYVDESAARQITIMELNRYGFDHPGVSIIYITQYDATNYRYGFGFSSGITFETRLRLVFQIPNQTGTIEWSLGIEYQP
jgi:hypothetical protein